MTRHSHPDLLRMIATAQKAGLEIHAIEQAWVEIAGEVRPVSRVVTKQQDAAAAKPIGGEVEW